jgi:alginate O-acetyltransferase complex protein AlgJ
MAISTARRRELPPLELTLVAFFFLVLGAPVFAGILGVRADAKTMRFEHSSPFPARPSSFRQLAQTPMELQRYFNTHFPFRASLMHLNAWLKVRVAGVSSSEKVVIGDEGWLFFAGGSITDSYRKTRPFTDEQLATWSSLLVRRRDRLRQQHIPYLFVVAPNPQTIYGEHMPRSLWQLDGPSRLDQLLLFVRSHTDVDILDLRPALKAAKDQGERVYYKTDTHWNQLGGFVAYEQISGWMAAQFPNWRSRTMSDFSLAEIPNWSSWLSYALGAPDWFQETRFELRPRTSPAVIRDGHLQGFDEIEDAIGIRPRVVCESPEGEVGEAVVFRDSYFAAPGQFLPSHFRKTVLVWSHDVDWQLIAREHPNVVVQEMVERDLMAPIPEE